MLKTKYSDGFFSIDKEHGFLPLKEPLRKLPKVYSDLQVLIDNMPIEKEDGTKGLLYTEGAFEQAVLRIENHVEQVRKEKDPFVRAALFRAYSFVCSAYTLAPAHHHFIAKGSYGKANRTVPVNIAQPFAEVADQLGQFPFLDYHYSYSLGNYYKINPEGGFNWENLGMAAKFSGMSDECGFIMLHVDINQYSPLLIEGSMGIVNAQSDEEMNHNLELVAHALKNMNERRKLMWEASRWKHYNDFRVFIMGVKGNTDIFEDGLIYEGVWDEPKSFRGQTGAQDNIIPTADIISGVVDFYPQNQLTQYLIDLRQYRPVCVQDFLKDLKQYSSGSAGTIARLKASNNQKGLQILLKILEEIYLFRNGHWQFVQKYIMSNTAYPKATGGTPITSWIPNQIKAVLGAMTTVDQLTEEGAHGFDKNQWKSGFEKKVQLINKQLEIVQVPSFNPEDVFKLNAALGLNDA
tara:strand:- start:1352 stop:2740 length:1389 start_codon:yes stop_codon:yes gene_type:complete